MDHNDKDAMRATLHHVRRVGSLMLDMIEKLQRRAMEHDDSKFGLIEFDIFAKSTSKLSGLTYGSPEYDKARSELSVALDHHYANNRHHPEFHEKGIKDMDLMDLIEMLADWKAAGERHEDGCLSASIVKNASRFEYDDDMMYLLTRTAVNMGWIKNGDFVLARNELRGDVIVKAEEYSKNGIPILSLTKKLDALKTCALSEESKEDAVGHLLDLIAHLDPDGQIAANYLQYPRTPISS